MKILFLDVDGVLNNAQTRERFNGYLGIDRELVKYVKQIVERTGCQIVVSSTWRLDPEFLMEVEKVVGPYLDVTPVDDLYHFRGNEIFKWIMHTKTPPECYAILDDTQAFYRHQPLFKTDPQVGITPEIVEQIVAYLNKGHGA